MSGERPTIDWPEEAWLAHLCAVRSGALDRMSRELRVSLVSLVLLLVGWHERLRCWTWPMYGLTGTIEGLRTRYATGEKKSVKGSRAGVFSVEQIMGVGPLLVVEGASDTAAGLDLGLDTIGRAAAHPGRRADLAALRYCTSRDVVVVADCDETGQRGAHEFGSLVLVKASPRSLKIMIPPQPHKDLRAWVAAGLTRDDLLAHIDSAQGVRFSCKVAR